MNAFGRRFGAAHERAFFWVFCAIPFVAACAAQAAPTPHAARSAPASTTRSAAPPNPDVIQLPGTRGSTSFVRVEFEDGPFAVSSSERMDWVRVRARAVADYYGGFPVESAVVALLAAPGERRVVFGKTLTRRGARVVIYLGTEATPEALAQDWVLVHELFHLGFPTFNGEGEWLDEGLATYAEPLIRARAGLLTEAEAWAEVTRGMSLGVRLCESRGLEHPNGDVRAIYWGGAVVALLADTEARRRTAGARGVEDGLRAVLAQGGNATKVWPLARAIDAIDGAVGSPVLAPLAALYADHGSPVSASLENALRDLGIERKGATVALHDDAPLAAARRRITYGADDATAARRHSAP